MSQFSAKEPSLGYHYQIRYALYLLLKTRDKEDHFIKLENLDDVEVGDLNTIDLHQTKFHNQKAANLTDTSDDIWKTLRVWSEMINENQVNLDNALFLLITTSKTSEKSVLHELTERKTGVIYQNIVNKLDDISKISKSEKLKDSFIAYNKLTNKQKIKLIQSTYIVDNALGFEGLKREIKKELQLTCLPHHIEGVFQELQGWWYEQCIQHLQGKKDNITFNETRTHFIYLNDKIKSDCLPIDSIIREAEIEDTDFDNRIFVNQLKEINIGKNTLKQAKRDFYRASEQRSKWLREELLDPQEEIDYEFNLKDDWKRKFALLQDEIDEIDEDSQKAKCQDFFKKFYVLNFPQIYIRPRVTEQFIVTGSCHMLTDKRDVAWHPKYLKNK